MSNTNNLTDYVLMPGPDYQDMCNAIREKTGITGDIISSQIGNIIRSIQGSVVLPTHTVNFYNDTTLLQSYANVVYGSTVTYTGETPAKASTATMSYTFDRFEPSGARIIGDTNCYAQFIETAIEPEEPTTGEWVPFCADGTTWMGEQVTEAKINTKPVIITDVVLSETNQYRLTVNGAEYICIRNEENDGYSISCDGCPVIIHYDESLGGWCFADDDSDTRFSGTLKVESWTGSEPYAPEEVTYEWVPMAADGVSYMGETVTIPHANKVGISFEYIISKTDQYRVTINGAEYTFSLGDKGMVQVAAEDSTVIDGLWIVRNGNSVSFQRYDGLTDVTATIKFESYVAIPSQPETDTNWVLLCADGTTWSGEEVSNNAMLAGGTFETIDLEQVVTNQYRLTVDGTAYLCVDNGTGGSSYVEGNAVQIEGDGCPATIIAEDDSISPWVVTFNDGNAHTLKVEVWIGSEPYVPEEEGYVPTDGYQAFTTDGTWTGEEVTTAGATDWSSSDLRWVGDTSTTIEEGMNILVTVNGVQYNCSVTSAGRPKARYVIASDGCPVTIEGGCDFTAYWAVFPTAGTYTLKVEVPTDSQEVDCATFIPMKDHEIASGSLLNFQVSWGERPYEEFEGYLDGNADIAAYSYYDGRARGYVVRLINNGDADLTVSSDVTYTIIITNVIVE